ncbi:MAG: peptide chain release factor N(5)-glutamine methyltransferase, partial [Gammaproteobacteria bacterium]
ARAWLRAHGDQPLPAAGQAKFDEYLRRRRDGEPIAYLVGEREFWSLTLAVTPAVLIPRPDTEVLVGAALELVAGEDAAVADLGTGSGAIALALATTRPSWRIVATDLDPDALAIARANAAQHAARVEFHLGDWCAALSRERFDLIVSNPPYVADDDPHLMRGDVRYEPRAALAAGPDGLDCIREITACAPAHLVRGGWLLLEHGYDQADAVSDLLTTAGFGAIKQWKDLGGIDRVTGARLSQSRRKGAAPTMGDRT